MALIDFKVSINNSGTSDVRGRMRNKTQNEVKNSPGIEKYNKK